MNIVTNTSAVTSLIIRTKHAQLFTHSDGSLHNAGQEILRITLKTANIAVWVIACRIEVSQSSETQILQLVIPFHKLLDLQLCKSVIIQGRI